jgi:hypothetical protein
LFIVTDQSWPSACIPEYKLVLKNKNKKLLPKWFSVLEDLQLDKCMMPRDVTTHWNSTFDMLDFVIQYQTALHAITSNLDLDLQHYKLDWGEWRMAHQLHDVLKV